MAKEKAGEEAVDIQQEQGPKTDTLKNLEARLTQVETLFERVLGNGLGSISAYEVREWRMKRGLKP